MGRANAASAAQEVRTLAYEADLVQPASDFGRPWDLAVGPRGRLHATYPFEGEVRILDPTGAEMEVVPVAAPLEVDSFPRWVRWTGEDLWLLDFFSTLVVQFDGDWRPTRSHAILHPEADGFGFVQVLAVLPDDRLLIQTGGNVVGMALGSSGGESPLPGTPFTGAPLWIAPADGSEIDTLTMVSTRHVAAGPVELVTEPGRRRWTVFPEPFRDSPLFTVVPGGATVIIVDRAVRPEAPPTYTVRRIAVPSGDTLSTREYPYAPMAMTEDWLDAALEPLTERVVREDPDEARRVVEDVVFIPPWLPPASEVRAGPDGALWIRREEVPGAKLVRWDVIDGAGDRVGSVVLRADLRVRAVHGLVAWATEETESRGPVDLWRVEALTPPR